MRFEDCNIGEFVLVTDKSIYGKCLMEGGMFSALKRGWGYIQSIYPEPDVRIYLSSSPPREFDDAESGAYHHNDLMTVRDCQELGIDLGSLISKLKVVRTPLLKLGDTLVDDDGDEAILAEVNCRKEMTIIPTSGTYRGSHWTEPVNVHDSHNITEQELKQMNGFSGTWKRIDGNIE